MDTMTSFGSLLRSQLLAVCIFSLAAVPAGMCAEADITGDWEVKLDRDGRQSFVLLSISKDAAGKLTGKWGRTDLENVKFDGKKLTFVRTLRFGDREFSTDFEATLKDGSLKGMLSSDRGDTPATLVRRQPKNPALGSWDITFSIGDREINATLAIARGADGHLTGKWTSSAGEHVVSNVKFQDGKLSFSRQSKFNDFEFESTYEGAVKGDELAGTIKSDRGDLAAPGKRLGAAFIGDWELTSETQRGPRTRLLTINADLSGRYEWFGGEMIALKNVNLDGGQVGFTIEYGFGDQTFSRAFKGKLDGKTLKGEIETRDGSREITGKKVEPPAASPLVGTWEISRQGRNGVRTSTLKIKADMTGTYTARENTVAITDLRLEGDQLSFKAIMKFREREVPIEFKGKLDGAAIKGQYITARGEREFTAKRVDG